MKKLKTALNCIILLFIVISFSNCDKLLNNDPCDETAKQEIEVSIRAIIHVLDKNKNPIPNQQVTLYLYKIPCGAEAKGRMEFSGPTDAQGIRATTTANYNLRNLKDEIWVDAYAVNLGNGSAYEDSEYVTYTYNDFVVGITKEVHVYIYRNF